jgi:hypothetical protein
MRCTWRTSRQAVSNMDATRILYDEYTRTQYRPPLETPRKQRKRPELGTAVAWLAVLVVLGIVIMTAGGYWPVIENEAVGMLNPGHSTSHANTPASAYVVNLRDGVTTPPVDVRSLAIDVGRKHASSLSGTPTIKPTVVSRPTPTAAKTTPTAVKKTPVAAKATPTPAMSSPVPSASTTPSPSVSPTTPSPSVSPTSSAPAPTET